LPVSRGWIYWDKKISTPSNWKFSDGEIAWTSFDKILRKFTYDWIGVGYINNPGDQKKIHVNEKVRAAIAYTPEKKAAIEEKFAERRLEEMEKLEKLERLNDKAKEEIAAQIESHTAHMKEQIRKMELIGNEEQAHGCPDPRRLVDGREVGPAPAPRVR
jgi:hypothetical protein